MKTNSIEIQKFMSEDTEWNKLSTILLYVGLAFIFLFNLLNLPSWFSRMGSGYNQVIFVHYSPPHKTYIENKNI